MFTQVLVQRCCYSSTINFSACARNSSLGWTRSGAGGRAVEDAFQISFRRLCGVKGTKQRFVRFLMAICRFKSSKFPKSACLLLHFRRLLCMVCRMKHQTAKAFIAGAHDAIEYGFRVRVWQIESSWWLFHHSPVTTWCGVKGAENPPSSAELRDLRHDCCFV